MEVLRILPSPTQYFLVLHKTNADGDGKMWNHLCVVISEVILAKDCYFVCTVYVSKINSRLELISSARHHANAIFGS